MDGPNPTEMSIKVLIPAPTFRLKLEYQTSIIVERNISTQNFGKNKTWDKLKNKIIYSCSFVDVIVISLLVYFLFRQVASSGIWKNSVANDSIS